MTIVDYTGLQADVTAALARTSADFIARIPAMIADAEERLYNGFARPGEAFYSPPLRVVAMEHTATVAVADGVGPMPADCLDVRSITYGSGNLPLVYVTPGQQRASAAGAGSPQAYTVEGSAVKTWPASTADLDIVYFRRFNALQPTGDDFTNALLVAHPRIYAAAVRAEAYAFIRNMEMASIEIGKLAGMITGANKTATGNRYFGRKRVALPSGGGIG
jgi:hypothetical protein